MKGLGWEGKENLVLNAVYLELDLTLLTAVELCMPLEECA
jgi:hypothetical protein